MHRPTRYANLGPCNLYQFAYLRMGVAEYAVLRASRIPYVVLRAQTTHTHGRVATTVSHHKRTLPTSGPLGVHAC